MNTRLDLVTKERFALALAFTAAIEKAKNVADLYNLLQIPVLTGLIRKVVPILTDDEVAPILSRHSFQNLFGKQAGQCQTSFVEAFVNLATSEADAVLGFISFHRRWTGSEEGFEVLTNTVKTRMKSLQAYEGAIPYVLHLEIPQQIATEGMMSLATKLKTFPICNAVYSKFHSNSIGRVLLHKVIAAASTQEALISAIRAVTGQKNMMEEFGGELKMLVGKLHKVLP